MGEKNETAVRHKAFAVHDFRNDVVYRLFNRFNEMSNTPRPEHKADQSATYQIRIKGHLGPEMADWFEGLTITRGEDGDTLLTGSSVDQAALYGLLRKVRDLGMQLLAVNVVES